MRFYIKEGLVPPASGRGRSAYYTPVHVQHLARISAWRTEHRSLAEIRAMLHAEQSATNDDGESERWVRMRVHEHLELHVREGAPAQIHALVAQLRLVANEWFYGGTDN